MAGAVGMSGSMLRVTGVELRRGAREILRGTTFDVPRGGLTMLMGPSGSGKTTMLRAVAALDGFEAGVIAVEDVTLTGGQRPTPVTLRRLRQRVGLVFQFHYLFEHLTALENVVLAPVHVQRTGRAEAIARARALLASLAVEHRAGALPRELSGGEAQRVAIARALATDPPLLMLDEPTASLDAARRDELGSLLRGLAGQGRTMLISTHDLPFAERWADHVLRMEEGRVVDEGS